MRGRAPCPATRAWSSAASVTAPATTTPRAAWLAEVRASGIEEPALEAVLARMEHDRNARLADQLAWMAEAGFRDVELWFKQYFFVVYAGRS